MRTSIDIPDALMKRLKKKAAEESTTLRQLIVDAVQQRLAAPSAGRNKYRYVDCSVPGEGLMPGLDERDGEQTRAMIYGDRA